MWKTEEPGLAVWQDDHCRWCFDLRGGPHGIGLVDTGPADQDFAEVSRRLVSLQPVDQAMLPRVADQFVRGRGLHLTYPQGDGVYELRIVFRPIESEASRLVLEATIAIQTDRLDTHPKIDLVASGHAIGSRLPADFDKSRGGSAPITVATDADHSVAFLLGPHDSPFTTNHSTDSRLCLRLFGDFLEKGVIRKARPWIVVSRGADPPDLTELEGHLRRLCVSPLPLTA